MLWLDEKAKGEALHRHGVFFSQPSFFQKKNEVSLRLPLEVQFRQKGKADFLEQKEGPIGEWRGAAPPSQKRCKRWASRRPQSSSPSQVQWVCINRLKPGGAPPAANPPILEKIKQRYHRNGKRARGNRILRSSWKCRTGSSGRGNAPPNYIN